MKVLFVTGMHATPTFPLRGVIIQRLASALEEAGHEIQWVRLSDERGVGRYLKARSRVRQAVAEFQPDLVHLHFGYSILAVPRVPVPIVTSFHGDDLNGTLRPGGGLSVRSRVGILISHYAAWRSRATIAVSETLRNRLRFASLRRRTAVVRDAIDTRLFHPYPRDEARRRLGADPNAFLVLFPHDVSQPTKRVELAQAAVAELQRTVPGAKLWIVNGKPADEMPWYYSAADVMLVTSVQEGGPSSAKEALACGLRVVSVPVGDVQLFRDVPEHTRMVAPDPAALAAAIRSLPPSPGGTSYLPPFLEFQTTVREIARVYQAATGV
ncbi:MAG: glycosyltransferase family 4 protein [Gemmatimonadota bacterium]